MCKKNSNEINNFVNFGMKPEINLVDFNNNLSDKIKSSNAFTFDNEMSQNLKNINVPQIDKYVNDRPNQKQSMNELVTNDATSSVINMPFLVPNYNYSYIPTQTTKKK